MATEATIGLGFSFEIGDGATPAEAFTALAEIKNIDIAGISRDAVDATHSASPDGYREFVGGLRDGGNVTFTLNFDADGTNSWLKLKSEMAKDEATNYRIGLPDGTTKFPFSGLLVSLGVPMPLDGVVEITAEYKVTGKPGFITVV